MISSFSDKVDVFLVKANSIRVLVKSNDTNETTKWVKTTDGKSEPLVFQNKVNRKFIGKVKWENYTSILINDLTNEDWNSYLSFIKGFDSSIQTKKLKEYVGKYLVNIVCNIFQLLQNFWQSDYSDTFIDWILRYIHMFAVFNGLFSHIYPLNLKTKHD